MLPPSLSWFEVLERVDNRDFLYDPWRLSEGSTIQASILNEPFLWTLSRILWLARVLQGIGAFGPLFGDY